MSWVRLGFIFFSIVSFQLEIPIGQKLIFLLKAVTTVVGEVALEHPPTNRTTHQGRHGYALITVAAGGRGCW